MQFFMASWKISLPLLSAHVTVGPSPWRVLVGDLKAVWNVFDQCWIRVQDHTGCRGLPVRFVAAPFL